MTDSAFPVSAEVRPVQETLPGLENLVKTHIKKLSEAKEAVKVARDALEQELDKIDGYTEAFGKQSEGTKKRREIIKKALENNEKVMELNENLKDAKEEAKDIREGLSTYLGEYQVKSGKNTIEIEGKPRKIKRICSV